MPINHDQFGDDEVFSDNFDPFKEEEFVYKTPPEGSHFKLHIQGSAPKKSHKAQPSEKPTKRTLRMILQDAGHQILASAVILLIGFTLMNYSALSKVVISKYHKITGTEELSPLNKITEVKTTVYNKEILKSSSDPNIQKRQIPELDMEISPNDNRIIIPRINQNIPIANVSSESLIKRDWEALEKEMQEALREGVVHYPGTSLPGQTGNVVITGHSSYFPWDPGRFKDVFALLHDVVVGDRLVVYFEQDKYLYEIVGKEVVLPKDIDVLKQTPNEQLTLITCTPVGTNLKRLIATAKLIAINDEQVEASDKVLR
ncbi:MAG: class E sortase [bacterium]|nr:class E sortase [bacterium]